MKTTAKTPKNKTWPKKENAKKKIRNEPQKLTTGGKYASQLGVQKKVKFALEQAMKFQRGSRDVGLLYL
jgi:hypothetical protein